mgnify:FL=1
MKKFIFIVAGLILTGFAVNADTTNTDFTNTFNNRGYGNAFIFVEDGIEFSVFPDGQFDFNLLRGNSRLNVSIGSPNVNISFNSGYDYNAYVQYDEYGAIIQIENTPIYYDYYGRIVQAGNVNINYNNHGYVSRVGGLYIHYNNYNVFSYVTGYINVYNRHYVYRPWHRYYRVPAYDYCVVYNRPYRQYYAPVRYVYTRPFYNNYRPKTAIYSRRGESIERNREYATVYRSPKNVTQINRKASSRRYEGDLDRSSDRVARTENRTESSRRYESDLNKHSERNAPQVNSNANRRDYTNNTQATRINSRMNDTKTTRESVNRPVVAHENNPRTNVVTRTKKNNMIEKPNNANSRTYTKSNSATRSMPQVTQRTSERTVSRTVESKPMAAKTRSNSGNNNTRSEASSRRRS